MSKRTTAALAVVALAMAAFIVLYEREQLSTGDLASRRTRVLRTFVRPRVTQVELSTDGSAMTLFREREEDLEAFEIGHWTLTAPIASDADQEAVDGLLSSLEYLEARRTLSGVSSQDLQTFGLSSPRTTLRYTVAGQVVGVMVGGDDPRGEGVYVAVSDRPADAFIVGRDFVEALGHDLAYFRAKEVLPALRSIDVSDLERRHGEELVRLERAGAGWVMRAPTEVRARTSALDDVFQALHGLRAAHFVAEDSSALASFGLAPAAWEWTFRRERTDRGAPSGPSPDRAPLRLRIGGPCAEHPGELAAIADDRGPVVCVRASDVAALEVTVERFRETRLVSMRDDEVERVRVDVEGRTFEVRREEDDWILVRGASESPADAEALAEWMRGLRAAEATAFEPATESARLARGLVAPRAEVTLSRADGAQSETLTLGASDADGAWVRRGGDPQLTRFASTAEGLLLTTALRFRARVLNHDAEGSLRSLEVVRGQTTERVERSGTEWRVTAPLEVLADRAVMRDAARQLASLAAVRFVAEGPIASHGLERPSMVVSARFEGPVAGEASDTDPAADPSNGPTSTPGPRTVSLRIGASTEGGAFAQWGADAAVFIAPAELVDALVRPLASRDLLATDQADLEALVIEGAGQRIELRRDGDGWRAAPGSVEPTRTTSWIDRLASLRAQGVVSYGPAPAEAGFEAPRLVLDVTRRRPEASTYRIEVGAASDSTPDAWYYARRTDLDIVLRVSGAFVRTMLGEPP